MRPESVDMESNTYFCTALASGLVALHKKSPELSSSLLQACTVELVDSCDSEFTQIHVAVASALRRIVSQCYDTVLIKDAISSKMGRSSSSSSNGSPLLHSIAGIESIFQLRYQHSWVYICGSVRSLFEKLTGETSALLLSGIVTKIAALYQAIEEGKISISPGVQPALGDTLGSAIRSLGISKFLSLVPLIGPNSPIFIGIDESREWILTLLHTNLKIMPCRLGDFGGTILPIAKACSQAMLNPDQHNLNEAQVKFISRRINQFWSLFPDFCYFGPTDITANINRLAPLVDGAMKDPNYPDIQPYIISGLTYLAKGARDKCPIFKNSLSPQIDSPDLKALTAHAQTFLPSVLVFLEKVDVSDPRFQSGVLCVAAWTSISPPPLVAAISKKLLQMLLTSSSTTSAMNGISSGSASEDSKESAIAAGWIAVIQAIIPHLSNPIVLLLYKTIRPLLTVDTSLSLQKRAYHVLDTLLKIHSDVLHTTEPRSNILAAISESLLSCHVSARSMRLRCIETLMGAMPNEEISAASSVILGEILICQKDANKKSRESAMDILKMMVRRLPAMEIITQLCSAIVAETTVMRSSAVIGMCLLLFERRDEEMLSDWAVELSPTIFLLLKEESTEMTRAVLSFIRVCCVVLPLPLIEALLPQLVEAFTLGLGPYKAKFSSRSRAIMRKLVQRLGDDNVRPLIPELDIPLLDHIQRQQRRAERKKSDKKDIDEDKLDKMMGSDSDDSDDDNEERQDVIDPRLVSRPKAQRVTNLIGTLPRTLEEMMYDQTPNFASLRDEGKSTISKRKENGALALATASHIIRGTRAIDEDEEYKVMVNRDGRVVIEHRQEENEESSLINNEENENKGKRSLDNDDGNNNSSSKQPEPKKRTKELGEEYKSKKAGGDVWKKGMLEPHAFIPLDARLLNKKNHREAVETFGSVIKGGGGGKKAPNVNDKRAHIVTGNRNQRKNDAKHGRYKNIGKTKGQVRK
jgi:ribosomal RNA-processing protein 12